MDELEFVGVVPQWDQVKCDTQQADEADDDLPDWGRRLRDEVRELRAEVSALRGQEEEDEKFNEDSEEELFINAPIEASCWEASIMFFLPEVGTGASVYASIGLIINIIVQCTLAIVIFGQFDGTTFDSDDITSLQSWRINVAHDVRLNVTLTLTLTLTLNLNRPSSSPVPPCSPSRSHHPMLCS